MRKLTIAAMVSVLTLALIPAIAGASHGPPWNVHAQSPYQFTQGQMSFRGETTADRGVSRILIRMRGQKSVGGVWRDMFSWDDCHDCVAYEDSSARVYHSFNRFCAGLTWATNGWNWVRTRAKGMVRVGGTWDPDKFDNSNGANMKC